MSLLLIQICHGQVTPLRNFTTVKEGLGKVAQFGGIFRFIEQLGTHNAHKNVRCNVKEKKERKKIG